MLSHALNRLTDRVVPPSSRQDAELFRQSKRVAAIDLVCLFWTLLFAALYAVFASPRCGLMVLLAAPIILTSLTRLHRGRSTTSCGNLLCFAGWFALTLLAVFTGGSTATPLFWYTALPFIAVHTAGTVSGVVWTAISLASVTLLAAAEVLGVTFPQDVPVGDQKTLYFLVLFGLVICHYVLGTFRVAGEQRARVVLREANRRLAESREAMRTLEAGFGFSVEAWEKMKRENVTLERLVAEKFHVSEDQEDDDDEDSEAELDRLLAADSDTNLPPIGAR